MHDRVDHYLNAKGQFCELFDFQYNSRKGQKSCLLWILFLIILEHAGTVISAATQRNTSHFDLTGGNWQK